MDTDFKADGFPAGVLYPTHSLPGVFFSFLGASFSSTRPFINFGVSLTGDKVTSSILVRGTSSMVSFTDLVYDISLIGGSFSSVVSLVWDFG